MPVTSDRAIAELPRLVAALPPTERELLDRLFEITETLGRLEPPDEMRPWIEKLFGSVDSVREQRIVRVTNRVTLEGALFNELRSRRPMEVRGGDEVRKVVAKARDDPFCRPLTGTPADEFGRVEGAHGITASNVAKYDGFHGVLVFDEHDPLAPLDAERLADRLATSRRWAERAHEVDPEARYYFLLWNSLWRAGGSIVHGHMQMTVAKGSHYPKVEALRAAAERYRADRGRDYFADLVRSHETLGLTRRFGDAVVIASITPIKERELVCLASPGSDERALVTAIAKALEAYRRLGVLSWNLALVLPPLSPDGGDWSAFRAHARLVDRGDPANRTSDIGAMELYAVPVVAADPFRVIEAFE